jgi:hypothetical protein
MSSKLTAATVVAGDTKNTVGAFDEALLSQTLLLASAIQAAKLIELPISETQKLFTSMHRGAGHVLEGRQEVQNSIARMHEIARAKGLEIVLEGCVGGFPVGSADKILETKSIEPAT